jgi:hypothetical protein
MKWTKVRFLAGRGQTDQNADNRDDYQEFDQRKAANVVVEFFDPVAACSDDVFHAYYSFIAYDESTGPFSPVPASLTTAFGFFAKPRKKLSGSRLLQAECFFGIFRRQLSQMCPGRIGSLFAGLSSFAKRAYNFREQSPTNPDQARVSAANGFAYDGWRAAIRAAGLLA